MNPANLPIACELFAQWQRARGAKVEVSTRPFSRGWEALLEDAGLVSATERGDAERDARSLVEEGWVEIKSVKYKSHFIDRIIIPLAAEARWCGAFGFVPPTDEEARIIRELSWQPQLAFLRDARLNVPSAELRLLNDFLAGDLGARELVPIKERSIEIFGDEKRLDALLDSALFLAGRLELGRDLRCEVVGEPLPWKRGPASAAAHPVIVIENAATWHSYCRWNAERGLFSAVVYGCGNRFVDGVRYLADVFDELGGPRQVFYFGDLDPPGLLIPQRASRRSVAAGLPAVEPHLWSYCQLLANGEGREQRWEGEVPSRDICDWLEELAEPAWRLFAERKRHAQERVGWTFLRDNCEAF